MKFAEERSRSSIIHVSPFNSEKKRAGVAVVAVIPSAFSFPPCLYCFFELWFTIRSFLLSGVLFVEMIDASFQCG
jgi:hypothetical protein